MTDARSARYQFGKSAEQYLTSKAHDRPDELRDHVEKYGLGGGLVVDVGTGAGHMAYALSPSCGRVKALDPTPEMLEVVKRESARRGLENIETLLGIAEDLPFATGSVDGVTCRVAAHHFHDVTSFVGSCARILRPGGWLWVADTTSPEDDAAAQELDALERLRDPSHGWNHKPSEWREHVSGAGLELVTLTVGAKEIDLEQWLDRMQVHGEDRKEAFRRAAEPSPALWPYLNPRSTEGRRWFDLPEVVLFVRKP